MANNLYSIDEKDDKDDMRSTMGSIITNPTIIGSVPTLSCAWGTDRLSGTDNELPNERLLHLLCAVTGNQWNAATQTAARGSFGIPACAH